MTLIRCPWCGDDPLYLDYHDREWGVPVKDDLKLFEFLTLETFQAGLSWITVLRKRENFRLALDGFDFEKIANYDQDKLESLILNRGIIRNKLKINATVGNARAFMRVREQFETFSNYIWGFVDHKPVINHFEKLEDVPARTALSDSISADLKSRGFKFVGSTIVYAHMQATGMVNDHLVNCFRHPENI
jgi:DNA-3-methyladenine glycosylase I